MNNLEPKFCDKLTGREIGGLLSTDDTMCPTEDAMSLIQYIGDYDEASHILWQVQKYYEAAYLRIFFYWPLTLLLVCGTVCLIFSLLMYAIYWLNECREDMARKKKLSKLFSPGDLERIENENAEIAIKTAA